MRTVLLGLILFALPATAQETSVTRSVAFDLKQPQRIDASLGGIKLVGVAVSRLENRLIEAVLPPRGGQGRFSWLQTVVQVANPTENAVNVEAHVRLLDSAGAVIDEYELSGRAWRGKTIDFKRERLMLNYVLPMIASVEVTVSAAP